MRAEGGEGLSRLGSDEIEDIGTEVVPDFRRFEKSWDEIRVGVREF